MSMKGLASFAAGLGTGYLYQLRRNDDLARQDRLDAMREKEFGLREQEHALRIDEANAAKRQREAQAEMDRVEAEALAPVASKQVALAITPRPRTASRWWCITEQTKSSVNLKNLPEGHLDLAFICTSQNLI